MDQLIDFIDDKEDVLSEDKEVITFITKLTFERFVRFSACRKVGFRVRRKGLFITAEECHLRFTLDDNYELCYKVYNVTNQVNQNSFVYI
jgi:hypothetical protein